MSNNPNTKNFFYYDPIVFSEEDVKSAKESVQMEFNGYGNGHSEYMVVDVDKDQFLTWAATKSLEFDHGLFEEPIGGVSFEEGNGVTVARFSACEKYGPQLNGDVAKAFPDAIVYGWGCWDSCYIEAPDGVYETELDEVFADGSNLRIDVKATDKKSGCSFCIGDLICFDSADDCENPDDATYDYLTSLINWDDRQKVEEALNDCKRSLEEDDDNE